jgi:hypothetical protein
MKQFMEDYSAFMEGYGFDPECDWSENLWDAEFCSALFWPCNDGYVLGPKIGRLMPKMGFSLKMLTPTQVNGVFVGYKYNANHVPLLNDFIAHHITEDVAAIREQYKINNSKIHKMTEESIYFFEQRYSTSYYHICQELNLAIGGARGKLLLPSKLLDSVFARDN